MSSEDHPIYKCFTVVEAATETERRQLLAMLCAMFKPEIFDILLTMGYEVRPKKYCWEIPF